MKEKIIAAFKLKFPSINLSKKRLDAIAAKIEAKVIDDETKIDANLETLNDAYAFADIAKDDDRARNLEAKLKEAKPGEAAPPKAEAEPLPDDTPAWAKALVKQNETLTAQVSGLLGEKQAGSIRSKVAEKLKADVPEIIWGKRSLPGKDEDIDAFIEEAKTDFAAYNKSLTDAGLAAMAVAKPATGSNQQQQQSSKEVPLEVKNFVEKQNKQAAAIQPAKQNVVIQ
jgi:hypothetical protein